MPTNPTAALAIETSSASGSVAIGRGPDILGVRRFTQPRAHAAEFLPSIAELCREHNVKPDEIGFVFVSAGPGSFTGLRIGITAARTLSLAVGTRVVALPTLEVIAQNALDLPDPPPRVCVILDAKRARVYTATFALEHLTQPPLLIRRDEGRSLDGWPRFSSTELGAVNRDCGVDLGHPRGLQYAALDDPREADPATYFASQPCDCGVLGEGVMYHQAAVQNSGLRVLPSELFPPRVETVYRLGTQRASNGLFVAARDLIPVYIRPPEAEEVWTARHG